MKTIKRDICLREISLWFVLQSLILGIAQTWLEQETKDIAAAKAAYLAEHCPAPDLNGDLMVRGASTNC